MHYHVNIILQTKNYYTTNNISTFHFSIQHNPFHKILKNFHKRRLIKPTLHDRERTPITDA